MNSRLNRALVAGALLACAFSATATADVLWDNNTMENGIGGRAISPPGFPNIRVADDFQNDVDWVVQYFHWTGIEDSTWMRGDIVTVTIYNDNDGVPDGITIELTGGYSFKDTGRVRFSRSVYDYSMEFDNVFLRAGSYWIGVRHDDGGGSGTNYWLTSDGGPDGAGSSTGYLSLDRGENWIPEGTTWHHAFEITGIIPAPAVFTVVALAGLCVRTRRRA